MARQQSHPKCGICGKEHGGALVAVENVRPELSALIGKDHPDWRKSGYICHADLLKYRQQYVGQMLQSERSELSALDETVIASIAKQETLSEDIEVAFDQHLTAGNRWADRIASFGGSWTFIGAFAGVLFAWIVLNVSSLFSAPFDPYPFILLNLVLSCIAAVQAPLIMMSQRRQEDKDRLRSRNDYRVNLKAELEIRLLHEKLDHLLLKQWERLAEIQQIQLEIMEEIAQEPGKKRP
jgi:uncharacterized membrane protein